MMRLVWYTTETFPIDRGLTVLSTGGSGFGENQLGLESIACALQVWIYG